MARKKPISEILHAEEDSGSILIVIFVPSRTKDGNELPAGQDQRMWAGVLGDELTRAFGGSTQMPACIGKWVNDDDDIITEEIVLIHSYASQDKASDEAILKTLAVALHRMGRDTLHGEVGVIIDSIFYKIRKFPLAKSGALK